MAIDLISVAESSPTLPGTEQEVGSVPGEKGLEMLWLRTADSRL
jgi:hypothetical protein